MITSELKDKVLNELINSGYITGSFYINEFAKDFNVKPDFIDAILKQLEELNLATFDRLLGGRIDFELSANAFDFFNHGGFVAQELLLKQNIEKLMLEIEQLKSKFPEKANLLSNIITAITSALALFK